MFETPEKHTHFYTAATGDALLSAPYFTQLIPKIKTCAGMEDENHYHVLYTNLVLDFAAIVQAAPIIARGKAGTLLIYSLERAVKSLETYHQASKADMDIRFGYAVFTAALLQNIGKILGQQKISICDTEGNVIDDWLPHKGPMPAGAYYRLWFLGDQWLTVSKFSSLLLARQVMPSAGFNWIAEDLPIYKMWLEAIVGEGDENENKLLKFIAAIDPAESGGGKRLPSTILRPHHPKATEDGDAFLEWLIEGLESGKISTNELNSMVHILASGELFLTRLIFQEFLKQNPRHQLSWEEVCDQFAHLGLTDNLTGDKLHFDTCLIQQKDAEKSQSATTSMWSTSHFLAQRTSDTAEKVRGDHMVQEGVVVQSLLFRGQSVQKDSLHRITRQHAGQEQSKEVRSLNKIILDSQQTRPTTAAN